VFQKDLGPQTDKLARKIESFDPDQTWTKVNTFWPRVSAAPCIDWLQKSLTQLEWRTLPGWWLSHPHLRQTCPAPHTRHLRAWRRITVVLQTPLTMCIPASQAWRACVMRPLRWCSGAMGVEACADAASVKAKATAINLVISFLLKVLMSSFQLSDHWVRKAHAISSVAAERSLPQARHLSSAVDGSRSDLIDTCRLFRKTSGGWGTLTWNGFRVALVRIRPGNSALSLHFLRRDLALLDIANCT